MRKGGEQQIVFDVPALSGNGPDVFHVKIDVPPLPVAGPLTT